MDKWPGAPFSWYLHPAGAPNKTLISNTDIYILSQAVHKKNMFPVQRVNKIEASRAAAVFGFFSHFFFIFQENIVLF